MNSFTIKDLENLSGIKAHTIRVWEQRYGFLKPKRTETNIRYYSNDELKTILNVALLNKYGFKISHIGRMQPHEMQERIMNLNDGRAIQERIVNELVQTMVDLDMDAFERVISSYISSKGIERAVTQILFLFLEKIGILWQTGHIHPAQEHLVTNVIRQKLIVAIESTGTPVSLGKTFLLFLPEGEHHELGLLFMYYMLKTRGAKTIYLGANVPLADVEQVVTLKKPDLAFIHLTGNCSGFNFEKFLGSMQQRVGGIKTIVSGQLTQQYKKKVPDCIHFKKSLSEVMEYLSTL